MLTVKRLSLADAQLILDGCQKKAVEVGTPIITVSSSGDEASRQSFLFRSVACSARLAMGKPV